jgi:hypothetical protein
MNTWNLASANCLYEEDKDEDPKDEDPPWAEAIAEIRAGSTEIE